jgi:hypothetical protein
MDIIQKVNNCKMYLYIDDYGMALSTVFLIIR